jgi:cyclophilin family peptidyl-prolyl cis-trans isomerase/HEAT repeat protein
MTLFLLFLLAQAAQGPSVPAVVVNAEKAWAGGDVLWPLANSGDPNVRQYAIRAIGRLEDPANVPRLLALARQPGVPPREPALAIAQSLTGFDPARDAALIASAADWLRAIVFVEIPNAPIVNPEPASAIQYSNASQVRGVESAILRLLEWSANDTSKGAYYLRAVRSLESLARVNARVTTFAPETVTRLSRIVGNTSVNDVANAREAALAALIASRGLDSETELVALRDAYEQVRRLATAVLAGGGAGLEDGKRLDLILEKLRDPNGQVRYEAVRGFVRRGAPTRGCDPLVTLLSDADTNVALAAIDALGDQCKSDEEITKRLVVEARTPSGLTWHRPAHAFVALAKRAPGRAAMAMEAFVTHPSWWVRMYAARAASAADDAVRLDKLAYDTNDNVREAALGPLRRLKKGEADAAVVAALDRLDVQLLRTAATLLKESPPNARIANALSAALLRLTKEGKETSRDARVPLLEALAIHAGPEHALELQPLLKDFDPVVAAKAAPLVSKLTGKAATAEPVHVVRGWPQHFPNLNQCVTVNMASGKSFTLGMDPVAAPVTVDHFLKLALVDRYYDGLAIHRIAPNFVIQGGGPGANEYAGHKEYMRDEVGARNSRGTVGLSTRGRNTADAQFYVNLIDNPRLDSGYTVFAHVLSGMAAIDAIEEGDVMGGLTPVACSGR